jgi:DNA helicase-2/ATP-dependent DNA helicase PcrA
VPGSGKTYTLSALAAKLIVGGRLSDDQEVLVVTLVNSAVDNFSRRVAEFVQRKGQLPHLNYRVRTLHGLAHDIVREHPGLVGLADDFQIVDERAANEIREDAVTAWLRAHPAVMEGFLSGDLDENKIEWVRRNGWPKVVGSTASSFIRRAKDLQQTPAELRDRLDRLSQPPLLAEMGCAIYEDYQRALAYRGAVDFDDLIRLALQALDRDRDYLERLRHRWPFILEDEAQDSSQLQEEILRRLAGPGGNWVRVGDPNQAIYETFTTADPRHLREFLREPGVAARELPNSGRSTQSIIDLANYLIDWTRLEHPVERIRDGLALPHIQPTPEGDPQPNPADRPEQVRLLGSAFSPEEEMREVIGSLVAWLPNHLDETVAVLVPRNERGGKVIDELKKRKLPYVELLRSTESTRATAGTLANVVRYLADPSSARKLARAYEVWRRDERDDREARPRLNASIQAVRKCPRVEDFLWPRAYQDWLEAVELPQEFPGLRDQLAQFRALVRRWQAATLLPIDQLILTLAQDLFREPADLAVAHKLAQLLGRASEMHPDWQLPELNGELAVIARNQRRFLGLSGDDTGFDPERHRGKVVVATVHKAKGLEWDRVYLMSVNNYDFPSGEPHDNFIAEKWFIRGRLNLEAEALSQLEVLVSEAPGDLYEDRSATRDARLDYVSERVRLLYVGITRARKDLIVSWNKGQRGDSQPAVPFIALQTFWEERTHGSAD